MQGGMIWPSVWSTPKPPGSPAGSAAFVTSPPSPLVGKHPSSITWHFGIKSGRWAKTLKFGAQGQKTLETWSLGTTVKTGFHFYPGITNPRALPANEGAIPKYETPPTAPHTFASLLANYATLRSQSPWHRHQPFLALLTPGENNTLIDQEGMSLPYRSSNAKTLIYQSLSGGHPILTCAEWDGHSLTLLSAASDEQFINLS